MPLLEEMLKNQYHLILVGPLSGSSSGDLRYTSLYETDYDFSDAVKVFLKLLLIIQLILEEQL